MAKVKVLLTRTRSVLETAEVEVEVDDFQAEMLKDKAQMEHWAKATVLPTVRSWKTFAEPAANVDVVGKVLTENTHSAAPLMTASADENIVGRLH